jgi:uncharacterized protein with HEPN domain
VPPREWRSRFEDMREAIRRIEQYTAGLDQTTFAANQLVIDAVIRNLTVIGEAARGVPGEVEAQYAELPWMEMRGMRNLVVHEYFGVDVAILWQTLRDDLPGLVPLLERALES